MVRYPNSKTERGQSFSKALLELARREKMTLRDLYNITAAARGHWVIYGSPKRIADTLEDWFTTELADGFVVMPADFPVHSTTLSTRLCPSCNGAGYTGRITRERR